MIVKYCFILTVVLRITSMAWSNTLLHLEVKFSSDHFCIALTKVWHITFTKIWVLYISKFTGKCFRICPNLPGFEWIIIIPTGTVKVGRSDYSVALFWSINPCNYSPFSHCCHIILTYDMSSSTVHFDHHINLINVSMSLGVY